MSVDKYPSIFSRQMKAIVYLVFNLRGIVVYYQRVNYFSFIKKSILGVGITRTFLL